MTVDEARLLVAAHPQGHLPRPARAAIKMTLGPEQDLGKAHATRSSLAFIVAHRGATQWNEATGRADMLATIHELARSVWRGSITSSAASSDMSRILDEAEGLAEVEAKPDLALSVCAYISAAVEAFVDDCGGYDEWRDLDDDAIDSEDWSVEFIISIIISGSVPWNDGDVTARRAF